MERPGTKEGGASDSEMAMLFIKHIENPCKDLHGHNIRDFYIREARRILPTMKNPEAREALELVIEKYSEQT